MLFLQILVMITQANVENNYAGSTTFNFSYYIGYFSTGIIGLVLLIFGCKAYNKGLRSEVILHTKTSKLNTVVKWISFPVCLLIAASYIISAIQYEEIFDIFTILMVCSTLSLSVYLIFYLHKRPSCLFSASLIFLGITYIYGICSNITFYILDLPEIDNYELYIVFGIIPRIVAGILYIVIATMLYKERFSVTCIKILGWTVLALELSNRILADILVFGNVSYFFYNITNLLLLLLVIIIFLYTSVFKLDTLRNKDIYINDTKEYSEDENAVRFCRKCGAPLLTRSEFCSKCGTEIIRIGETNDEV